MARLQSKSLDAGTITTANLTFDLNVTAASLLIASGRSSAGTTQPTSVTDNINSTYASDKKQAQTLDNATAWFASFANSGAGTITVTETQASGSLRLVIIEYSGMATASPLDQTNGAEANAVTSVNSGNITTTQADEVLIGASGNSSGQAWTVTSGFTLIADVPTGSTSRFIVEEQIVTSTGTYSSQPVTSASSNTMTLIASYKVASQISVPITNFNSSLFPKPKLRVPMSTGM